MTMSLRIGFDLDGVLADMELALVQLAEHLFGSQPDYQNGSESHGGPDHISNLVPEDSADDAPMQHHVRLTAAQRGALWRHVCATHDFWESLPETEPGIVARLATMAREKRWEIVFLTRRPATAGAMSQIQSQRWLEAKGFRLPSVFVVNGTRGQLAAALALDAFVDDLPQNCLDIALDSKARAIGVFRHREAPVHPALTRAGVYVVHSAAEALDLLCKIDSKLTEQPAGAIERLMRTLGVDPTSKRV